VSGIKRAVQPARRLLGLLLVLDDFNLVDAFGAWIWNQGRPADIPA
jgi:hypothetical protein